MLKGSLNGSEFSLITKGSADDTVAFSKTGTAGFISAHEEGPRFLLKSLSIAPYTVTVPQLIAAAKATGDLNKQYSLLNFQCYYFAAEVYYKVQRLAQNSANETLSENGRRAGTIRTKPIIQRFYTSTPKIRNGIDEKYQETWERVRERIDRFTQVRFHYAAGLLCVD